MTLPPVVVRCCALVFVYARLPQVTFSGSPGLEC